MRQKGKAMKSQVSIGRKPGRTSESDDVFLMICTKQDRNGAKYKVSNAPISFKYILLTLLSEPKTGNLALGSKHKY
jgi:hypothetical protein